MIIYWQYGKINFYNQMKYYLHGRARQGRQEEANFLLFYCCSSNFKLVVGSRAVGIRYDIYFPTYSNQSWSCCPVLESNTNASQSMPTHFVHTEISYKLCKLSLSIIYKVCHVGNFLLFACEPVWLCVCTCMCVHLCVC